MAKGPKPGLYQNAESASYLQPTLARRRLLPLSLAIIIHHISKYFVSLVWGKIQKDSHMRSKGVAQGLKSLLRVW